MWIVNFVYCSAVKPWNCRGVSFLMVRHSSEWPCSSVQWNCDLPQRCMGHVEHDHIRHLCSQCCFSTSLKAHGLRPSAQVLAATALSACFWNAYTQKQLWMKFYVIFKRCRRILHGATSEEILLKYCQLPLFPELLWSLPLWRSISPMLIMQETHNTCGTSYKSYKVSLPKLKLGNLSTRWIAQWRHTRIGGGTSGCRKLDFVNVSWAVCGSSCRTRCKRAS